MSRFVLALLLGFQLSVHAQKVDSLSTSDVSMEVFLDDLEITDRAVTQDPSDQNTDVFLHQLNGVSMMRRGNFANEPMLRGMTTDRVIVTIDGMKIFGACTDKMDPVSAYVEPINMRNLEVKFGGSPSMLGNSTGGAINFQLKKPVYNADKPVEGTVGLNYGSVAQSFDQLADINLSGEKLAVRFSGVHRKAENYTDGNGEEVKYSQYEKYNYAASLSYRFNGQLLNFDFIGDDGYDIGYPALTMDVSTAKAKMFSLTYMGKKLAFLNQPELKIYHNYIHHVMDDTKRDSVAMHMDMPGNTHTTGMYLKGLLGENLQTKLEVYRTFAHADMVMYEDEEDEEGMYMETWPDVYRNLAGYELGYTREMDAFVFRSGGRIEVSQSGLQSQFGENQLSVFNKTDDNSFKTTYSVSVGLDRVWSENSTSSIQLSSSSRLPTITEQFGFYLYNRLDGFDYIGDPDIKNEKTVQLDLTHRQQTDIFSYQVAAFAYWFEDYILGVYDASLSAMTIGSRGVKWYTNTDHAWMFGGEAAFGASLTPATQADLKASYVFGEDYEGDPLPQMPPLKTLLSVSQQVKGFVVTPQWEWSAQQNRTSEKFYEQKTDSYHVVNLDVAKTIDLNATALLFNLGVRNLFDEAYREHFDIGSILRPGRQFYINMKLKF